LMGRPVDVFEAGRRLAGRAPVGLSGLPLPFPL
jgi:hypothetical protein